MNTTKKGEKGKWQSFGSLSVTNAKGFDKEIGKYARKQTPRKTKKPFQLIKKY